MNSTDRNEIGVYTYSADPSITNIIEIYVQVAVSDMKHADGLVDSIS
jgi:hypothetical protein